MLILFAELFRVMRLLDARLRIRSALVFLLLLAQSLLELGFILTLTSMAMALSDSVGLRASPFYQGLFWLFPALGGWAQNTYNLLLLAGMVLIAVCVAKNLVNYLAARGIALLGEDISLFVGMEIMQRYLYQNYAWHLSAASDSMYQRMMWRGNLALMLTHMLNIYACAFTILILFLSLVGQEPALTTLVLGVTGVIGAILYASVRRNVDKSAKTLAGSEHRESTTLLCAAKGIREVLLYGQQRAFLQGLSHAALQGRQARVYSNIVSTMPTWVLEATGFVVVVGAIAFMVHVQRADVQRITAALTLLLLTAWRVLPFCNRIVSLYISVRTLRPKAEAVLSLLESLRSGSRSLPPPPAADFAFTRQIELRGVSYRYAGTPKDSLSDITLTLRKGRKVGLIGLSGAGKSTLAGILSGLLPVSAGQLLVDGRPLAPAQAAAFTRSIGYVPQNPFLFAGTLAENIAFSQWGKPWDEQRVREACALAAIDFAHTHPAGLRRPVGENGVLLSGGQAQRVAIARALYARPQLLIFDEATSSLDQSNEDSIQQTIDKLSSQITCVIIAHRLSTVRKCDSIVWLHQGRIVMQGTAETVLAAYEKSLHQSDKHSHGQYSQARERSE